MNGLLLLDILTTVGSSIIVERFLHLDETRYPLEGIKVIDLTLGQQGPYATQMLADWGAEVIKVEPRTGEFGRRLGPWSPKGLSAYFEAHNRSKKSITVDIKQEKGREIVYRLVQKADLFAQNFRPGVTKRLGFCYEILARVNPKIIYLTGSAYGPRGPHSGKAGLDGVGQAMSGLISVTGLSGAPDQSLRVAVGDQTGAFLLAFGAMMALFHRERSGVGQEVDVSLVGSVIMLMGWTMQSYLFTGEQPPKSRARITGGGQNITCVFRAKDGKPVLLHLLGRDMQQKAYGILGMGELLSGPKFVTGEKLVQNQDELIMSLDKAFLRKDREEWLKEMDADEIEVGCQ